MVRFRAELGSATVTITTTFGGPAFTAAVEVKPAGRYVVRARHVSGPAARATTDAEGRGTIPQIATGVVTFYLTALDTATPTLRTAWLRY